MKNIDDKRRAVSLRCEREEQKSIGGVRDFRRAFTTALRIMMRQGARVVEETSPEGGSGTVAHVEDPRCRILEV